MKALLTTLLSIALLPACMGIAAQQSAPNPVQSTAPAQPQVSAAVPASTTTPATQLVPASAFSNQTPEQAATSLALEQAAQPAAGVIPSTYIIGPDDSISVTVWRSRPFRAISPFVPMA
jgi:hypothetical protein